MTQVMTLDMVHMIGRLTLAAILGGIIGWERGQRQKHAGLKTHLMVSLGSALITLTSMYGFQEFLSLDQVRFDPSRIAAQIVSGIGFLGAGAILRRSDHVISGLTTAATIWAVAGIGIAVGSGFYFPAIITTLIILASTVFLPRVEHRFMSGRKTYELFIEVRDRPGTLARLSHIFGVHHIDICQVHIYPNEMQEDDVQRWVMIEFRLTFPAKVSILEVIENIKKIEGVRAVDYHSNPS